MKQRTEMSALSQWLRNISERIRKLQYQNSIAIPIVLILLFIVLVTLVTGFYVNKSVFYSVFEERESNKARNIHLTIESIVSAEVKRISSIAKILKNDTDIVYGLFHHTGTHGDTRPLKSAMDQLYPKMNIPVFVMADPSGNILYKAGKVKDPKDWRLRLLPGFRRALRGEQVLTASQVQGGWGIWAFAPVYAFGTKKQPSGIIMLGVWINDAFAKKIAQETGSEIFVATSERVISSSHEGSLKDTFDLSIANSNPDAQKPYFQADRDSFRSYTYVPLKVVDSTFWLVIETDISVIKDLLARNKTKMEEWGILLLIGIAAAGFALARILVWPLNRLSGKAVEVIREYSGTTVEAVSGGNEITTLVRANDVMLETIKNHLSERTRAEEALRETTRTLEALIEASPLAVVVTEASGIVRVWNPAAAHLFGWRMDDVIGHPNPLLCLEGNAELSVAAKLVMQGERISNKEIRAFRADESEINVAFSGAPLLNDRGAVAAMMAIIADISDAKKAEMALRRSEEQLRQSQKMEAVGRLAGGVAHDFNNLLSVITGYTELLLFKLDDNNPARREIEEIHRAGERAGQLTGQLLAYSRRQVMQPKHLELRGVVDNLSKMIRRVIGEDIDLIAQLSQESWTVRADPSQMEQVLLNLVVNARDAMPGGGKLVITTENVTFESPFTERDLTIPPGDYATLGVSDNGCGMDEAVLSRIFEPFFTTKEQGRGTGLGLATVYGIVKQSGGFIRVQSARGVGTSITVYLPKVLGEYPDVELEATSLPSLESGGKETILVVEDEEMVRELAVESLIGYGYAVLEAPCADKALSISAGYEREIDLLITDLVMPGMNGMELAKRFLKSRPRVPVLFMSGYSEDAVKHLGDVADKGFFLQKPITPSSLSRKVREVLSAPVPA